MTDRPYRILLLGSYNGQDSLGDECLLKSTVAHLSASLPGVQYVLHSHAAGIVERDPQLAQVQCNQGLQSIFWWWSNKWRHTRLPLPVYRVLAAIAFPAWLVLAGLVPGGGTRRALAQLARAEAVFVFGGTNFTRQWFWLNAPHYFLSCLIARCFGAHTYFGPQQYGPMSHAQRRMMSAWLRTLVRDFRVRNGRCLDQLGVADPQRERRLVCDEVYSNVALYPQRASSVGADRRRRILLNVRGGNLTSDTPFDGDLLGRLAPLLRSVARRLGATYTFFSVSGASFCDDERSYAILAEALGGSPAVDLAPRFSSEHELIELAADSIGCISMSFHGCVLSAFAGIPAVPISDGEYYEYKYADFSRYGDGSDVPVIRPLEATAEAQVEAVVDYIERYDAAAAARRRAAAARTVSEFYAEVAHDLRGRG